MYSRREERRVAPITVEKIWEKVEIFFYFLRRDEKEFVEKSNKIILL
jgi:hypothetical protein